MLVALDKEGAFIVTAAHVVAGGRDVEVTFHHYAVHSAGFRKKISLLGPAL